MLVDGAEAVVLIHGSCLRSPGWGPWSARYSARGYSVVATAVPLTSVSGDCLRPQFASGDLAFATGYYELLLKSLVRPPVLIGHCLGGVIVQALVERGLGAAGVALTAPPVPPSRFGGIRPLSRLVRPARAGRGSTSRAPLLHVGGGLDRRIAAKDVEAVAQRGRKGGVTGYLEYPDSCHHMVHGPGWEQVADDVLDWAELHTDPERLTRADLWRI
jgi:alpha-beta hydrolase superfamily lysophospholipase